MTTDPDGTDLRAWPTDRQGALAHGLSLLFDREHGQLPVVLACRHLAPAGAHAVATIGTRDPANRDAFAEHAEAATGLTVRHERTLPHHTSTRRCPRNQRLATGAVSAEEAPGRPLDDQLPDANQPAAGVTTARRRE